MTTSQKLGTAELLFARARKLGLKPAWLKKGVLFAVSTTSGERYLHYAKSGANSHLSSSMVRDKLITRLVLDRHNLPSIPFLKPSNNREAEAFLKQYKKIIIKPLDGSNSRDVHIITSPEQLSSFSVQEYIFEQYVAGREIRYLILNDAVIGVHESEYGESVAEDRDLRRISYPEAEWDSALAALSLRVAAIFGLRYGAVDYLISHDGRARILEVNSSPGMKWFHAPTSGPTIDVAGLFLEAMLGNKHTKTAPASTIPLGVRPVLAYS